MHFIDSQSFSFFWQSFNLLVCWANFFLWQRDLYEYQSFLVKQTFVSTQYDMRVTASSVLDVYND